MVNLQDVYDEFNDGILNPKAYRTCSSGVPVTGLLLLQLI